VVVVEQIASTAPSITGAADTCQVGHRVHCDSRG
jgi:hypothetical protein